MALFPQCRTRSSSVPIASSPSTLPLPTLDVWLRPRSAPACLPRIAPDPFSRGGPRQGKENRPNSSSATCRRQISKSSSDCGSTLQDNLLLEAPKDVQRLLRSFYPSHLVEKRLDIDQFVKAQAALSRALGQKFRGETRESAANGFFELQNAVAGGQSSYEAFSEWQLKYFHSLAMNWKEMVWLLNKTLAELVCDSGSKSRSLSVPAREQRRQAERQLAKKQELERINGELRLAKRKEFQIEVDREAEKELKTRTESILKDLQRDELLYHRKKEYGLRMLQVC